MSTLAIFRVKVTRLSTERLRKRGSIPSRG